MALESKYFKHPRFAFWRPKIGKKKKATQWRVTLEWYVQCKVPTYGICSLPKSWTTIQIKKACFNHTHLEARCCDVLNKIHLGGWGPTQLQQNKTYSHEIQNKKKTLEPKDPKKKTLSKWGQLYCHHIPSMFHVSPQASVVHPKGSVAGWWHPSPSRASKRERSPGGWWVKGHEDGGPMIQKKIYEIIWIYIWNTVLWHEIRWSSAQCITWFHLNSSFSTRVSSLTNKTPSNFCVFAPCTHEDVALIHFQ